MYRTPKNYDGTAPTSKSISALLPAVLHRIQGAHRERPDLLLAAWPEVIGEKHAKMTSALSFREGVLTIKVKNATLHSLLVQHEKARLLKILREKFPSINIQNIIFRIG